MMKKLSASRFSSVLQKFYFIIIFPALILTSCVSDSEPAGAQLSIGDPLPQFAVEMNTGQTVTTQSLRGKSAVIVFFNTTCPDCQQELPVIQQLWEEYRENPEVDFAIISREESEAEIEEYWVQNNLTMPFSAQENREVYSLFARSVIPRIYITDQKSVIVQMFDDSDMPTLEQLSSVVEELIAE